MTPKLWPAGDVTVERWHWNSCWEVATCAQWPNTDAAPMNKLNYTPLAKKGHGHECANTIYRDEQWLANHS